MERWDKDKLKNSLTIDNVFDFVEHLGGSPRMTGNIIISQTICHNLPGEGSYKLYYYDNTKLFKCYTGCSEEGGFDIYQLTNKVKQINGENYSLPKAIQYVAAYFGYIVSDFSLDKDDTKVLEDWKILENYDKINDKIEHIVNLNKYDDSILDRFNRAIVLDWIQEGISKDIMLQRGIRFNPDTSGAMIPHYDIDNNLIGIRERTMVEENEIYGKYRPSIINGQMYNHPLSFSLYNLNNSKDNIKAFQKAIIFESEKSCLMYASHFGVENDISVACCGSSLIAYQVKMLVDCGAKEIVVAFDRQYQQLGDEECLKWIKKLENIRDKYKKYATISFLFDKQNLLPYKASPIDKGRDIFIQLYQGRIIF